MTGGLSKNFHGVGIGPLSEILAVKIISLYLMRKSEDANRTEVPSEEIVGCGTLGHKC